MARNLNFVNNLLADKEALNAQVGTLSKELKGLTEKHEKKVSGLSMFFFKAGQVLRLPDVPNKEEELLFWPKAGAQCREPF